MNWTDIIQTIATNTVFLAVMGLVAKSIFTQMLSRDIEKFKVDLQIAQEKEIERLRADLGKSSFEFQTRFSKLHEIRAEVVAKLYELLVEAEATYQGLASDYVFTKKADINIDYRT